jgi:hypothetical protein
MKLRAMDLQMLRDAADVADAQQDLMEFMKRRCSGARYRFLLTGGQATATIAFAAIAILSIFILGPFA